MSDDIREVSEVTTETGVFGTRYVVAVDGKTKKFRMVEEASAYRDEQLERRELEKEAAAREAAEAADRAAYDQDPEYITLYIRTPIEDFKEAKQSIFGFKHAGGVLVDVEAFHRHLDDACYKLSRQGYEVVSITPLISGHAGFERDKRKTQSWGAGWGYSFTSGAVLLARRC